MYLYFSEREKPNHEKQRLAAAGKLFCTYIKRKFNSHRYGVQNTFLKDFLYKMNNIYHFFRYGMITSYSGTKPIMAVSVCSGYHQTKSGNQTSCYSTSNSFFFSLVI